MSQKRFKPSKLARLAGPGMLLALLASGAIGGQAPAIPQSSQALPSSQSPPGDLTQVSIENLMNIEVTSVSKKEQKLSRTAAAIFVITQEEIHRSGATNIPDLLRMAPGLDVAQINAHAWAISARGFNFRFSYMMLVMIDGRSIYTPSFGGVEWDLHDLPLEDIERIEVIRGPGATMWGANAMNGVINIITKRAEDTQGGLVTAGGGSSEQGFGTIRYGGKAGQKTFFRFFTKYFSENHLVDASGQDALDNWHMLRGGFRIDAAISERDSLTVQGDLYNGKSSSLLPEVVSLSPFIEGIFNSRADLAGGYMLARWNHVFSSRSDTSLHLYYDRYSEFAPDAGESRDTIDLDFQHHWAPNARHDLVWGLGYRFTADAMRDGPVLPIFPPSTGLNLFSAFVQDEITLRPERLHVILGTKLERNDVTHWGWQPSIRLLWTPNVRHTVWAAVSRALTTPARTHTGLRANLTGIPTSDGTLAVLTLFGNPKQGDEKLLAYELGYRLQPNKRFSFDAALFYNRYESLQSLELQAPFFETSPPPAHLVIPIVFANKQSGETHGAELASSVKLTDRWTVSAGYTLLEMRLHPSRDSLDSESASGNEGGSPRHQAQLRSQLALPHHLESDLSAYFVDRLPAQQVPAYTRLDARLGWRPAEHWEFNLVGQNLLQDHHFEFVDQRTTMQPSQPRRSAYAKLTWRF